MSVEINSIENQQVSSFWLDRRWVGRLTPALLLLAGIMLLSTVLHVINLDAIGNANLYYTAAVKSMLQSWHNFFFVAAEPGGSVSVDKPPLGLWIEAAFALVLGVNGVAVSLPNILAGILSIPLLYHLVRKYFGSAGGLIAGLVMALTPVVIAVDRNNTMDGMLTFTLLLAAWAFIQAVEKEKLRFLLLGSLMVGLGFNIKMLQAFLPLPAFYALYFLGSRQGWLRKLANLAAATLVLLAVSLSWALAVDLTPAEARPYVGSSTNNTVLELIIGHNGAARLLGHDWQGGTQPIDAAPGVQTNPGGYPPPAMGQVEPMPPGGYPAQHPGMPLNPRPPQGPMPDAQDGAGGGPRGGGAMFSQETGQPGVLRFFQPPLAKEMSWLLPFALLALAAVVFSERLRLPLVSPAHKGALLWGGWLLTCLVFFSAASFFHAYYMGLLAPALGAVAGAGFSVVWKLSERFGWWRWGLLLAAFLTATFQLWLAGQYGVSGLWVWLPFGLLMLSIPFLLLAGEERGQKTWKALAFVSMLAAMLVIPGVWSFRTALEQKANAGLVSAYSGEAAGLQFGGMSGGARDERLREDELLAFLQENTVGMKYLAAVPSAQMGAAYVIETGRPVLYMGGFSGSDAVVSADDLSDLVSQGDLRYVVFGGQGAQQREIGIWLQQTCSLVPEFSNNARHPNSPIGGQNRPFDERGQMLVYDCGK